MNLQIMFLPVVVVVPGWGGYTDYVIERQHYFAEKGYLTMSANIFGLPIGFELPTFPERIAFTNKFRTANNEVAKRALFGF